MHARDRVALLRKHLELRRLPRQRVHLRRSHHAPPRGRALFPRRLRRGLVRANHRQHRLRARGPQPRLAHARAELGLAREHVAERVREAVRLSGERGERLGRVLGRGGAEQRGRALEPARGELRPKADLGKEAVEAVVAEARLECLVRERARAELRRVLNAADDPRARGARDLEEEGGAAADCALVRHRVLVALAAHVRHREVHLLHARLAHALPEKKGRDVFLKVPRESVGQDPARMPLHHAPRADASGLQLRRQPPLAPHILLKVVGQPHGGVHLAATAASGSGSRKG